MANKVSFLIELKERFLRTAKVINKQIKAFGKNSAKAGKAIRENLTTSFKDLRKSASTAFLAMSAVSALAFRKMVKEGSNFQDSLADLSAITGLAGKGLSDLSDDILKLARDSVTSSSEVAQAFKVIGSNQPELLKNIPALKSMTKEVLLLKNAAGIDLFEAAEIASIGLNQLGLKADQISRVVNVLAAGAKFGSSEIRSTGEALLIASSNAVAAGQSLEQLNAAIQAVARGGIRGSQAGTALSAIFGRLRRAGFDLQKLGLAKTFEEIKRQLDNTTNSTKLAKLEQKFFGEEHAKVGLALVRNVDFLRTVEKQLTNTNVAQEQANIRLNTFSTRMRKIGILINQALIKTFRRLEPTLTRQAALFTKWIESLKSGDIERFADLIKKLANFFLDLGKGLFIVAKLFRDVGQFIGKEVAITQLALTGNFDQLRAAQNSIGQTPEIKTTTTNRNENSINGEIVVRATQGTEIESTKLRSKKNDLNIGLNVAAGSFGL